MLGRMVGWGVRVVVVVGRRMELQKNEIVQEKLSMKTSANRPLGQNRSLPDSLHCVH